VFNTSRSLSMLSVAVSCRHDSLADDPGGNAHDRDIIRYFADHCSTGTHDDVGTDTHQLAYAGAYPDPTAITDAHGAGQVRTRADVDPSAEPAIVIHAAKGIEDTALAHLRERIDHRAGKNHAAGFEDGMPAD